MVAVGSEPEPPAGGPPGGYRHEDFAGKIPEGGGGGDDKAGEKKDDEGDKTAEESDAITAEEIPRVMAHYPSGHWSDMLAAFVWPPMVQPLPIGEKEDENEDLKMQRRELIKKVGEQREQIIAARKAAGKGNEGQVESLHLPDMPTEDLMWRPKYEMRPMWYRLLVRIVYGVGVFCLFMTALAGLSCVIAAQLKKPSAVHKPLAPVKEFRHDQECHPSDMTWKTAPLECAPNCDVDNKLAMIARSRKARVAQEADPYRCLPLGPFRYIDCTKGCSKT